MADLIGSPLPPQVLVYLNITEECLSASVTQFEAVLATKQRRGSDASLLAQFLADRSTTNATLVDAYRRALPGFPGPFLEAFVGKSFPLGYEPPYVLVSVNYTDFRDCEQKGLPVLNNVCTLLLVVPGAPMVVIVALLMVREQAPL